MHKNWLSLKLQATTEETIDNISPIAFGKYLTPWIIMERHNCHPTLNTYYHTTPL